MRSIAYARPRTIEEAVSILTEVGSGARILAGGTDLIPQVNEYFRDAEVFVDAKRIPELTEVRFDSDGALVLGAAVPCCRIYEDARIAETFPGLVDSARIVGSTGIQSRASVGGNLCNSGPAADTIPPLIAYSAAARIAGPNGFRYIAVEDFCTGPGRNVLEQGEMLASLRIPPPAPRSGAAYLRFIPRNEMDIAVAGAAALLALDHSGVSDMCRIALAAVGPRPLYVPEAGEYLVGKPPTPESLAAAAEIAQSSCAPIDDMRGTAAHRRRLVGVLVRRALTNAHERAIGRNPQW